ncbi:MAG: DUF1343 domain-containing protein [Anaerolineae bacterium]|nr:DUF1343 domain-containing protein [Anaerolineae bacterium]MDQ7033484.1 DUF1343 domain-containing protein [Anaerolineae bacterium]
MIQRGIERLREDNFQTLRGKRVGLLTNLGAVDDNLTSTYEIFMAEPQVNLVALFGPEHGIVASALDAVPIENTTDTQSGIPIYSLYGDTRRPSADMLKDIDIFVCDIQDIGARFYTYIWTISYILEACGENNIDVLILDRPNPLGDVVAGSPLNDAYSSFVGRFDIPIRHGMTVGELSLMINQKWNVTPATVSIIPCKNWERGQMWDELGLEFVSTSPAMPHFRTALHYTGSCLLEGAMLSEGRGTSLPFEVVGAPYINASHLAKQLNTLNLAGVRFRTHSFYPTSGKFCDETCNGVQAHILDPLTFDPLMTWLSVIIEIRNTYRDDFEWLQPTQLQYEQGARFHFDRLIGDSEPRLKIDAGQSINEVTQDWNDYCAKFRVERQPFLIADYSGQ